MPKGKVRPPLVRQNAGIFDTDGIKEDLGSNSERAAGLKEHDRMLAKGANISKHHHDADGKYEDPGKQVLLPGMYGEHRDPGQKILHELMNSEFSEAQAGKEQQEREVGEMMAARDETEAKAAELGPKQLMTGLYDTHRDKDQKAKRSPMHKELKKKTRKTRKGLDAEADGRAKAAQLREEEKVAPAAQGHGMSEGFWDLLSDERKDEYTSLQSSARETLVKGDKIGGAAKVGFHEHGDDKHAIKQGKDDRFMQREVAVAQVGREMGLEAVGQSAMLQTGEGDRVASPLHQGKTAQSIMSGSDVDTQEGQDDVKRLANADVDDVQQIVLNDLIFNNRDGHMGQYIVKDDGHMVKIDQEALGASGKDVARMSGIEEGADAEEKAMSGESDDMAAAGSFAAGLPSATAPLTDKTRALISAWDDDAIENIAALMQAAEYQGNAANDGEEMFEESVRKRTIDNIKRIKELVAQDKDGTLSARDLFLEATKGTVEGDKGERKERKGVHPTMEHLEDAKFEKKGWVPEELQGEAMFDTTAQRFNVYGGFGKEISSATEHEPAVGQMGEISRMDKEGFDLSASKKKDGAWGLLEEEEQRQGGLHKKIAHEQRKANKKSKQGWRTKRSKKKNADKYAKRIADLQTQL